MIQADLHNHTNHSHGRDSVTAMYEAAVAKGLAYYGFSEHSARPLGYDYSPETEYREHLAATFGDYVAGVQALQEQSTQSPHSKTRVLLGLELDWLPAENAFLQKAVKAAPFDYIIGGIHFLRTWPFDATSKDWDSMDTDACHAAYTNYFITCKALAQSGLVNILAHPDIIKIFSRPIFEAWLTKSDSLDLIRDALVAVRDNGLVMEISSAGLRKPCAEIYPGPAIMRIASDCRVPIVFGSDAHCTEHVGYAFDTLAQYAASFGYTQSHIIIDKEPHPLTFI